MFAALGRFSVRFRYAIVAFWIVTSVLCVHFLPSLGSVTQSKNSSFLPASAPSVRAAVLAKSFQRVGKGTGIIIAATNNGRPLTPADEAAISRMDESVAHLRFVSAVHDQGISADGEARKSLVETSVGAMDATQARQVVHEVDSVISRSAFPRSLEAYFTGQLPIAVDTSATTSKQQKLTELLSILFIIALLLVVFRGLLAPFITLFPAALALVIAGPVIAEAAKAGVEVSSFTQFMLIVLMLGAGTDYGLFLIFRIREEIGRGLEPRLAVTRSLTKVGESIVFSGSTVILAFLTLLLASFGLYRGLGPGLAIAIAIVLVVDLTLLPALLAIFGKSVFWPKIPAAGSHREGIWGQIAGRAVGRPVVTLAAGTALFAGLALANLSYAPSGFNSATSAPSGTNSAIGATVLAKHFAAADINPTNVLFRFKTSVWKDPQILATATRSLSSSRVFGAVVGPLDPNGRPVPSGLLVSLHHQLGTAARLSALEPPGSKVPRAAYQAYRATGAFISPDGRTLQFYTSLTAGAPTSNKAMRAIPLVRSVVSRVGAALGASASGVAGEASSLYDVSTISGSDLLHIIPVVLLVIFMLLILLLRSLIAPLYLVVSVGLSYLAALGLAVLAFVIIGGSSGINFILPFFMFIFLMALGEDYNILVMSRIREEAHSAPLAVAVRRAIGSTGSTVTSAGLVLAGTFLVLTVATTGSIREIGIGLATGVLLDTFLVRSLLVPSTVVLLGRWNWWPSHLHHIHSELDRASSQPGVDQGTLGSDSLGSAIAGSAALSSSRSHEAAPREADRNRP